MNDSAHVLRDPPRWNGVQISAAAVACVLVLLAARTFVEEPDFGMVLGWFLAWIAAPVCLLFAGSWTELRLDPAQRRLSSRIGFLRWSVGPSYAFADFDRVVVVPKIETSTEEVNVVGGGFNTKTSQTRSRVRHELHLRGRLFDTSVPLPRDATIDVIEALAHELAAVGGWRPMRVEFRRKPGSPKDYELVEEALPPPGATPARPAA